MNEPTYPIAYTSEPGVVLMKATKPAPTSGGAIEPNPQRTHVGQVRVRTHAPQARARQS